MDLTPQKIEARHDRWMRYAVYFKVFAVGYAVILVGTLIFDDNAPTWRALLVVLSVIWWYTADMWREQAKQIRAQQYRNLEIQRQIEDRKG